jgi:hypothetical protein
MAQVVNAIAREKILYSTAIFCEQLRGNARTGHSSVPVSVIASSEDLRHRSMVFKIDVLVSD